jgi:hypothetical protein
MAAKLEWFGDSLRLGGEDGWTLGALREESGMWRGVLNRMAERMTGHEEKEDARQDLESEVRRLLKEAGVDLGD